jgi:TonB family protein
MNASVTKRSILLSTVLLGLLAVVSFNVGAQKFERKVIKKVAPVYPAILREKGIGGVVRLKVTVRADGIVKDAEVLGGNPILASSAVHAVKLWRFASNDRETTGEVVLRFDPYNK